MKSWGCIVLVLLLSAAGLGDFEPSRADLNDDGRVDIADLALLASAWLWESSCLTAETIVAETAYTDHAEESYWYEFTPTMNVSYLVDLCDGASGYTAFLYEDCEGTLVAMTDTDCWCVAVLTAGQTYFIEVENTESVSESFTLRVEAAGE